MARCLFSTLRLRVLFSQEIVPHFVYLLNPFLSVFPCKKAKSCFSKSFCRLARRWPRFPFARIPIFNALCLFFVLVPYSHLLEFPFARERTVAEMKDTIELFNRKKIRKKSSPENIFFEIAKVVFLKNHEMGFSKNHER